MTQYPPQSYPPQSYPPPQGMPPGVPPGMSYGSMPPAPATNGWGVASLICSLLGCTVIGALLGFIFGIVGLKRSKVTRTGAGMSIAGIIISILWVVVGVLFGSGIAALIGLTAPARAAVTKYITDLPNVSVDQTMSLSDPSTVKAEEIESLKKMMSTWGACTDVTSFGSNINNSNGVETSQLTGIATFSGAGKQAFSAMLIKQNGVWKVRSLSFPSAMSASPPAPTKQPDGADKPAETDKSAGTDKPAAADTEPPAK